MISLLIFLSVLLIGAAFLLGWIAEDGFAGIAFGVWTTCLLAGIWFWGLVIYVGHHFVVKYW